MEGVLTPEMNRLAGRAMHTYDMLADGDRVLIAVSGGADSLVLAWLLNFWKRKAPISYKIIAFHVDMDPAEGGLPGSTANEVKLQLEQLGMDVQVAPAKWQPQQLGGKEIDSKDVCYKCSRSRRKQLFDYARQAECNKIAFGHHQDDIIETFFINLCFAGNISTMVPRQDLFDGRLSLIRPLAYFSKEDILTIAGQLDINPVRSKCPLSEKTKRLDVRHALEKLYSIIPAAKPHIFAALGNVRQEYLLKPVSVKQKGKGN